MTQALTEPPKRSPQTFLNFPLVEDLDNLQADVAILGIPFGLPYRMGGGANPQSEAPDVIRAMSERVAMGLDHFDFDVGGPLLDGRDVRVVDCGNVRADPYDPQLHYQLAEQAARKILAAGAMPIVIGGDHGIPIPVFKAYDGYDAGEITLVHIDAHLDWRDEINGVTEGYSSPIRRASEMAQFGEIYQLGIRGAGSARSDEVEAANAYGAHIFTAYDIHEAGMPAVLEKIPDGGNYFITLDVDGLDPAAMPGVLAPVAGGLTFHQVRQMIHGLVAKGRVVGMDVNEFAPKYDTGYISAVTCGQFITNLIGASVRAGYFD